MRKFKKTILFFMMMVMVMNILHVPAFAATDVEAAEKTASWQKKGTYEVKIEVPGADGDNLHDEIILMVDGSYSMDNEWPAMKEAINTVGKTVLNGSGNTQLTLMAFGMGDNEVLVHVKDAGELAAALGELPGNLLYGRSSTNCEAGFTGVAEYIENHDESLRDVHVIFISDGNLNTDETPRAFDANWQTWTKFGALAVAQETFGGTVSNGENLPVAFTTVFGNRFDGATRDEIISRAFGGEVTDEEFIAFAEQLWTDVYNYSGLTRGTEYPVSDAERAFVKYDKENGTYIQDLFYYTTYKSAYVTYGDRWTRTPAAADKLAAMSEIASMYVVDYDGYTSWMDTGITSDKSTFVKSNGIAGLCEALSGAMAELSRTPYNDVVVTDYMSKWVNLDTESIKIVDNTTGEVIWTMADGWKITEDIPTAEVPPVVMTKVDAAEYEAGGENVIGNTNGDIYKLTWKVKDGALLLSDSYALVYTVYVDTEEEGFQLGEYYPANGNTYMEYEDENGEEQKKDIDVPDVTDVEERIINITKSTVIKDAQGVATPYNLEGIVFEVYYLCTVDEYTANISKYENPTAALVAGQEPVEILTTDKMGKAIYNLSEDGQRDGVYMIIEQAHPAIVKPLDPFLVAVPMTSEDGSELINVIDLHPKNDILPGPEVDKNVTAIDQESDTVDVGEHHTWIIRGEVPVDIAIGKKYILTDSLDYQLTYAGNPSVKLGLKTDKAKEEAVTLEMEKDYTLNVTNEIVDVDASAEVVREEKVDKLEVALTPNGMKKIAELVGESYKNYEIRVYFDAFVDEDGQMGVEIYNQADLYYKNSVGFEFNAESEEPYVYTCGLNLLKHAAGEEGNLLSGAVFQLARKATEAEIAAGEYKVLVTGKKTYEKVVYVNFYDNAALAGTKVNSVTTTDGKAVIYGLESGDYYLVEVNAPEGYNLLTYPVAVTLNQDSHLESNPLKIANSNQFQLPSTGGMGITIFTTSGMMILVTAVVLMMNKKKENNEA